MILVKKTAEYKVYKRKDGRYAVTTLGGKAINGEEKTKILLAEELIKVTAPRPAEEEPAEESSEEAAE